MKTNSNNSIKPLDKNYKYDIINIDSHYSLGMVHFLEDIMDDGDGDTCHYSII